MASGAVFSFSEEQLRNLRNDLRQVAMTHLHSSTKLSVVNALVSQLSAIIEKEYLNVFSEEQQNLPAYESRN